MRSRRRLPAAASALALLISGVLAIAVFPQSGSAAPAPAAGFISVWRDDFTGGAGSPVSGSNWLYALGHNYPGGAGNWGTGEVEATTNSSNNVFLDGSGHLAIKPIKDGAGNWTSGRIETQRTDFQAPDGGVLRIEASIQQPNVNATNGLGYWPAFWALGDAARPVGATNWPSIGELDIMETINGHGSVWATLHCGVLPGGPCNEPTGISSGERPCGGCQTSFHAYAVELDRGTSPEELRYYLDGNQILTVKANQVDPNTWNNATHRGFFVILNVAIGGAFPAAFEGGPTAATVSGQPMLVDYVSVSTKGGGGGTSTTSAPTTTAPVPTTTTASPGGGAIGNAYATIPASQFGAASSGINLGQLGNGAWAKYSGVDFGSTPATQFIASAASGAPGGVSGLVEVRLDSVTAPPIGSFAIANTGGWTNWRTVPANIASTAGVHDVYLTFASGQPAPFVAMNTLTFGPGSGAGPAPTSTTTTTTTTTTPVPTTTTASPGGGAIGNAYATIPASQFGAASSGINLGQLGNGAWAKYSGVDFGSTPATQFIASAASGAPGGVSGLVEVRLDSVTAPPIGSFAIANTGGWTNWRTVPANIASTAGVHDVYLTFTSGQPAPFVAMHTITFGH